MSYEKSDKKQLEGELREVVCPECGLTSYRGDWMYVKDGNDWGLQCPKCYCCYYRNALNKGYPSSRK